MSMTDLFLSTPKAERSTRPLKESLHPKDKKLSICKKDPPRSPRIFASNKRVSPRSELPHQDDWLNARSPERKTSGSRSNSPLFTPRRDSVLWNASANTKSASASSSINSTGINKEKDVKPFETPDIEKYSTQGPATSAAPHTAELKPSIKSELPATQSSAQTRARDPRLAHRQAVQSQTIKQVSHPQVDDNSSQGDTSRVLVNVIKSVQTQVSREYQHSYTPNHGVWTPSHPRQDLETQCKQLRNMLSQRDIEFVVWKNERDELLRKLDDMVAREEMFACQKTEEDAYKLKLQDEMSSLLEKLKVYENDKNRCGRDMQARAITWEEEKRAFQQSLEEQVKLRAAFEEAVLRERQNLATALEKFEQEKKLWKHERCKMIDRLRDERRAREGLVAALRLRDDVHERREVQPKVEEEQPQLPEPDLKRKRIED
ncbi:hypothetical protein D9613_009232 [Agrocybe pediades]|uniref:Uncharacterized protein n=1 Tax=Agrocybe pediades TaxID=84607 RepID=A0A8H4R362_9AGAR|nr:hypothetical protein D9613_009232 [Agrocybe pediades]